MSGSRVKKVIHRGSGREFGLSVVRASTEDRKSYLATRNQLLKFRGNNVLNVYAYKEERLEGSTYQLSVLQEWMPNLNLSTLVRSPVFANFSLRRKTGIFKSLATALKSIHSLELYHGNLSPEFVLLDTYHEVRLELVPFVNHFAEV
jgi:serine/threonine protein kinase